MMSSARPAMMRGNGADADSPSPGRSLSEEADDHLMHQNRENAVFQGNRPQQHGDRVVTSGAAMMRDGHRDRSQAASTTMSISSPSPPLSSLAAVEAGCDGRKGGGDAGRNENRNFARKG
ncbi:unnamed protein product, partial [Sphacelaria rigidula]